MNKTLLALVSLLSMASLRAQQPVENAASQPPQARDAAATTADSTPPAAPRSAPLRPRTRIEFALGGGTFDHETDGSPILNDDTSGGYLRLGFEHTGADGLGGGFRLEGSASEGDLFATDVEASEGELFAHFTSVLGDDDARLPVRIGLSLRSYTLDDPAGLDPTWTSIGPRVEIEPDLRLDRGDSTRWSLYGKLGAFLGYTWIETDPAPRRGTRPRTASTPASARASHSTRSNSASATCFASTMRPRARTKAAW